MKAILRTLCGCTREVEIAAPSTSYYGHEIHVYLNQPSNAWINGWVVTGTDTQVKTRAFTFIGVDQDNTPIYEEKPQ